MEQLLKNIEYSLTAFHAVKRASEILEKEGYAYLCERDAWKIVKGGKYYVTRNGSSLIAFRVGERFNYNIVASHTDSPCIKVKGNPEINKGGCCALSTEGYGGLIFNSYFDRKLTLAGRAYYETENGIECRLIASPFNVVIPSVAIHLNREVNNGVKLNAQIDMCPVFGLGEGGFNKFMDGALSYDLFAVSSEKGYLWGKNNEFFSSPRIDDLAGVFASVEAFINSAGDAINVLALLDNEEIGSRTRQGAASTFVRDTFKRIGCALGKNSEDIKRAFAGSMMLSVDNAHASHPNHLEYDDPTNKTVLGGGVALKHNAKHSYTTDAYTAAHVRKLFNDAGVKYQDYYVKSDLNGGSTLGIVSAAPLSIPSADIGLPQLGMHSAVESAAVSDYAEFVKGITAFYNNFKL